MATDTHHGSLSYSDAVRRIYIPKNIFFSPSDKCLLGSTDFFKTSALLWSTPNAARPLAHQMAISQLFLLSPRGDSIIHRDYRGELERSTTEVFFKNVKFYQGKHQVHSRVDSLVKF
eukprot:287443-Amorphochlora_amoeboformis.AAC.2